MRWNVHRTSRACTGLPLEYLMPLRSVNVQVLPPSVGFGIATARSGTFSNAASPPAALNATRPSWVLR